MSRNKLWFFLALFSLLVSTAWMPGQGPSPPKLERLEGEVNRAAIGTTPPSEFYLPVPLRLAPQAASHPLTDPILIDGVFSGPLIDGDGSASAGPGTAHPTKFVEQKKFDAADSVYYDDVDGDGLAGVDDAYWIDDGNGQYGDADDVLILGSPVTGTLVDALSGVTTIAYNDAEIDDNNRYDDGEDIYLVDAVAEFRGAMQRVVPDPLYPDQTLAHLYIASVTDTVFMHNDFIVDVESTWIDGDGTASAGAGTQAEIGFAPFTNTISSTLNVQLFGRWFTTDDDVYWKSIGPITGTWSPFGDALWLDADDDGVYSSTVDHVIVDTGVLVDGDTGRELNSDGPTPTYNFVYDDRNGNQEWDDGEAIGGLDGDEIYDWNYFDDRWSWLVDGDGTLSDGRGLEDETRIDGNTWFQADDAVYHWDADGNGDWNDGDGLWIDLDGDGVFSDSLDSVLVRGGLSDGQPGKPLQVELVDGDGAASDGPGTENTARRGQSPFAPEDDVFWYDVLDDDNWFWSAGDGLWIDDDGDGAFSDGVDRVLVRGSLSGGESGIRLSASAHHFGYDDGEVDLNGRYDPGEDVYAANTYLAYDDFELAFNGAYDPGEDVYDRDYIEIWVYAEGDSEQVPTDMYHPELEPGLRDVGFRVHVNGIRVDDPDDDYDAPTGFQAAAGWGQSRGAPPFLPAGAYNRHYEYKLPSAAADAPLHLVSNGTQVDVDAPAAPRIWETDHKIDWETCEMTWITHWKDLRRGQDDFQGFGSSSGQREESVVLDWLHPPPPPPPQPPIVIKEPLLGPILVEPSFPFVEEYCWSVFVLNPSLDSLFAITLTDQLPAGWNGGVAQVTAHPSDVPVDTTNFPAIVLPEGLPAGGWVEVIVCAGGPVEPTADQVVNVIDGEMDDDGDPGTPPVPIPGDSSEVPVFSRPEVLLFKWPDKDEIPPGGTVTWRIGVVNTGQVGVDGAELEDDVPDGLKVKTESGTLPSGQDVSLPLDTLGRGGARIVDLETEVEASLAPSTTLTNTLTLSGEFSVPLLGGLSFPYSTSVSASVHVTEPADCQACITGRVTFTDCTRPESQAALESVTVNIKRNGAVVGTVETDEDGNYQYCFDVPPTDGFSVEVLLQEGSDRFRVRDGDGGDVPTVETPQFEVPTCPPNPVVVNRDVNLSDPANSSNVPNNRRQALAVIYKETETALDFWIDEHGVNLPSPGPDVVGFSANPTSYAPPTPPDAVGTIFIAQGDSACTSDNRPMNREWHEFNHYVDDEINEIPPLAPGDRNWGGSGNSNSSDSRVEGWAQFWSGKTKLALGLADPHEYEWDGGVVNLEANYSAQGPSDFDEADAVASLLWDLHDSPSDTAWVTTVVTNATPPPITTTVQMSYTDDIDITNQQIYEIIRDQNVDDVKGLYDALQAAGIGQDDSDGDGINDLDELFIMHGFWGDDGDHVYEPDHGDDPVGWAGRNHRRDRPVPPGATMLLSVTLPGGIFVPTTTLNVDVAFDPPDGYLNFSYTHQLWSGEGEVEPFVPPPQNYHTAVEMWVTDGLSQSDHLRFGNLAYWTQVYSSPLTSTHALSHTFCLGGDRYDLNCDGAVSLADASALLQDWNTAFPNLDYRPIYDLDDDADVDLDDYQLIQAMVASHQLSLEADPTSIPVGGATSLLTAELKDELDVPFPDGTVITFSTSLGGLDGLAGTLVTQTTTGGVATATLTSGDVAGTARLTATTQMTTVMATVAFTSSLCPQPLNGVGIAGPTSGQTYTDYTFSAVVTPGSASLPITYAWTPTPTVGQGSATVTYTWATTGSQVINLQTSNCGGTFTAAHTIDIDVAPTDWHVYLPVVLRAQP